ncbi:NAD-dependent epimerase/dehydratase family protein [Kitasatospora sp. NPDC049285]|uniref:NAD-dependent epimerase/dehydratase family protein n=1 Tax=Kitasatospora sp. NPDC049285 TaxID=3157096 RepID=UPI0034432552
MRVLVTGASGFVGGAVVRCLAAAGHEVWSLGRRPDAASALPVQRAFRGDVRDEDAWRPALAGVDAVCHLAALTRGRESLNTPEAHESVNVGGVRALLAAVPADRPPRIVLASTAAVYGAPERQPIDERTPPAPGNPYGASKLAAERLLTARPDTDAVILRCFNAAGTGDTDETRIIPRALAVAAGRHPHLELNGDGSVVRDFVHVEDMADAYLLALTAPPGHHVFNVGATPASMSEIITAVERLTGRRIPLHHRPAQPEAPRLVADTTLLRTTLAWHPHRSTLDRMITDALHSTAD